MNETERQYDHIIVAVHGIGDQMRNATVRDVATRYARLPDLAKGGVFVAPQPLGYFHTDVTDAVKGIAARQSDRYTMPADANWVQRSLLGGHSRHCGA